MTIHVRVGDPINGRTFFVSGTGPVDNSREAEAILRQLRQNEEVIFRVSQTGVAYRDPHNVSQYVSITRSFLERLAHPPPPPPPPLNREECAVVAEKSQYLGRPGVAHAVRADSEGQEAIRAASTALQELIASLDTDNQFLRESRATNFFDNDVVVLRELLANARLLNRIRTIGANMLRQLVRDGRGLYLPSASRR